MKKILVTGGAGFIGSHLVKSLIESGNEVTVLDNFSTGRRENLNGTGVRIVEGDIRDPGITKIMRGIDTVYHMAAELGVDRIKGRDLEVIDVEFNGTKNLLEGCRRFDIPRLVFASTSEVYGHYDEESLPMKEDDDFKPNTVYGMAKRDAEVLCEYFSEKNGMSVVSVRYFNIYGPRQTRNGYVVPAFAHSLVRGMPLKIYGDGTQKRDFTYVDDAIEATMRLEEGPFNRQVFNIGSGKAVSIKDLAKMMSHIYGTNGITQKAPLRRLTDMDSKYTDVSKLERSIGFKPSVNLEDGLRKTLDFYRKELYKS